ncbi:MAG: hypothetical protein KAQ69_06645 [Spirochaetales bacterium]|nr:hypothetical protein [Spirochaetales bacterium]
MKWKIVLLAVIVSVLFLSCDMYNVYEDKVGFIKGTLVEISEGEYGIDGKVEPAAFDLSGLPIPKQVKYRLAPSIVQYWMVELECYEAGDDIEFLFYVVDIQDADLDWGVTIHPWST